MDSDKEKQQRLLVSGPVNGNFDTFFGGIRRLHARNGPFDAVLCTGQFLASTKEENDTLRSCVEQEAIPLPVYFVAQSRRDIEEAKRLAGEDDGNDGEVRVCAQLSCLGTAGVKVASGLKIAFVGNAVNFDQTLSTLKGFAWIGSADILLSSQWPKGIMGRLENWKAVADTTGGDATTYRCSTADGTMREFSLPHVAETATLGTVVELMKPRYHFVGGTGVWLERPPFVHGGGRDKGFCRFFSLGDYGNKDKVKFIYAFKIVIPRPREEKAPKEYTLNPFVDPVATGKRKLEANGQGRSVRPRTSAPRRQECWFCLQNPNIETHLITHVGKTCYMALAKGGVHPTWHVLVVPIEHCVTSYGLRPGVSEELEATVTSIEKMYASMNMQCILWERSIPSKSCSDPHVHLQLHPIEAPQTAKVGEILVQEAERCGVKLHCANGNQQPSSLDVPYFRARLPGGITYYASGEACSDLPFQLGRKALCIVRKQPERIDWRRCVLRPEHESHHAEEFKKSYCPFVPK